MSEPKEDVKVIVDEIRSTVGAEIAEKIDDKLIAIVTKTNSLVTATKESESEIKQLRAEAYQKRHELKSYKSEIEPQLEDFKTKLQEKDEELKNLQNDEELERLRKFEKETIETQKGVFKGFIEKVQDHPKFEKVQGKFKLPVKDDKIDFESFGNIEFDDLKHNVSQMQEYQEIDYFDSAPNTSPPSGPKGQRGSDKSFEEAMKEAKTQREIDKVIADYGVGPT